MEEAAPPISPREQTNLLTATSSPPSSPTNHGKTALVLSVPLSRARALSRRLSAFLPARPPVSHSSRSAYLRSAVAPAPLVRGGAGLLRRTSRCCDRAG